MTWDSLGRAGASGFGFRGFAVFQWFMMRGRWTPRESRRAWSVRWGCFKSRLPQPFRCLQYLGNLLYAGLAAFAEVAGEGGGVGAGVGEVFLDGGDLG